MKPSQVSRNRPQHAIVFGLPKTGKSTLVSKLLLSGEYNLTWISMDNGHEPLFQLGLSDEFLDEHVNLVILPDTKDQPVAIRTCLKIITGKETRICDRHGQVDCSTCMRNPQAATWSVVHCDKFGPKDIIVFDHLGQVAGSAITAILQKVGREEDEMDETVTQPQWGQQGYLLDKFLTGVQQAQYNIICISHLLEVEMEDGSTRLSPLVGTRNFSSNVGKYFDHMIYCHVVNGVHKYGSATTYQNKVLTGSRSKVSIEGMKEPTLVPFFDGTIPAPARAGAQIVQRVLGTSEKRAQSVDAPAKSMSVIEKEIPKHVEEVSESSGALAQFPEVATLPLSAPEPTEPPKEKPKLTREELLAKMRARK